MAPRLCSLCIHSQAPLFWLVSSCLCVLLHVDAARAIFMRIIVDDYLNLPP
jgi:hypothetical protein